VGEGEAVTEYGPGTGLVVVDCQNDFADPEGSLYVRGGEEVVRAVAREVVRAREAGATVVYTQDWHPESTPHFAKDGGIWPVHCVGGTWGAQLHPDLVVDGPVVRKGTEGGDGYSGFSVRDPTSGATARTELEGLLHGAGVERLVVVGLAQDYCVLQTVLDARTLGFAVEAPRSLTAAVELEPGDGERAAQAMLAAGASLS
jgi:nicotinamidase/pyrazinamidase